MLHAAHTSALVVKRTRTPATRTPAQISIVHSFSRRHFDVCIDFLLLVPASLLHVRTFV
jgi:hypothetical protein